MHNSSSVAAQRRFSLIMRYSLSNRRKLASSLDGAKRNPGSPHSPKSLSAGAVAQTVFAWIVINMSSEIDFVADHVFPKAPLPRMVFAPAICLVVPLAAIAVVTPLTYEKSKVAIPIFKVTSR